MSPSAALRRAARHLPFAHAKHPAHRGRNQAGIVERAQIDEPDAIGEVLQQIGGHLQRQPRLAHPTRSGERHQPVLARSQQAMSAATSCSRPIRRVRGSGNAARGGARSEAGAG